MVRPVAKLLCHINQQKIWMHYNTLHCNVMHITFDCTMQPALSHQSTKSLDALHIAMQIYAV